MRLNRTISDARAEGALEAADPAGEDDIHPFGSSELVSGRVPPPSSPHQPAHASPEPDPRAEAGPRAAGGADPAAAQARRIWGTRFAHELSQAGGRIDAARQRSATDAETVRNDGDAAVEAQIERAASEQDNARQEAKDRSAQLRQQWRESEGQRNDEAATEARGIRETGIDEVHSQQARSQNEAVDLLRQGDAEAEAASASAEAEARSTQTNAKSQSLLGWLADEVNHALAAVRNSIASIFERARATVRRVLAQAQTWATQALKRGRDAIVSVVRRMGHALIAIGDRVLAHLPGLRAHFRQAIDSVVATATRLVDAVADRLGHAVQSILDGVARALDALLHRLDGLARAIVDGLQAIWDRITTPITIQLDPIEVFGSIPIPSRNLLHVSTGDIPVYEEPIVTEVGVFLPLVTMRTDGDVAFRGGNIGPGVLDEITVTVAPFQDRYEGSGALRVDGEISAGVTLTGVFGGSVSWMGIAGLGAQGGPIMPFTLSGSGSMSAGARILYDRGEVSFQDQVDLGACLHAAAGVDAFLRFIAFTGLPQKLPAIGPGTGQPDEDLPDCEPGEEPDENPGGGHHDHPENAPEDTNALPYAEIELWRGQWNLEEHNWTGCLSKTISIIKRPGGSASASIDDSEAPSAGQAGSGNKGGGGQSGGGGSSGTFNIESGFRSLFTAAALAGSAQPAAIAAGGAGSSGGTKAGGKKKACKIPPRTTPCSESLPIRWPRRLPVPFNTEGMARHTTGSQDFNKDARGPAQRELASSILRAEKLWLQWEENGRVGPAPRLPSPCFPVSDDWFREGKFHAHHMLPLYLGGVDVASNLCALEELRHLPGHRGLDDQSVMLSNSEWINCRMTDRERLLSSHPEGQEYHLQ